MAKWRICRSSKKARWFLVDTTGGYRWDQNLLYMVQHLGERYETYRWRGQWLLMGSSASWVDAIRLVAYREESNLTDSIHHKEACS